MHTVRPLLIGALISLCLISACEAETAPVYADDLKCMTDNLYHEARGEPIIGQVLVGHSVINRMKESRWPSTVCGVVYQYKQYSWTLKKEPPITDLSSYTFLQSLAYKLLQTKETSELTGVNHYLRCDIRETMKDKWWKRMEFIGQVGDHCFYKD